MTSTNNPKPEPSRRRTKPAASPNPPTKRARLIKLLSARAGCDITSLSEKMGWQSHSTRAAMSGLRKAGYVIATEKAAKGKPARDTITAPPPVAAPPVSEILTDAG